MAMVDLAGQECGKPISLAEISERQGVSLAYLEQIFNKLRRSGLVEATRGPGGGYCLSAPANKIHLSDIMVAVGEPLRTNACPDGSEKGCQGQGQCECHDMWIALSAHILSFLGAVTLADIVEGRAFEFVAPGLGCKTLFADRLGQPLSAPDVGRAACQPETG